jgi:hypothetical protein
VQSHRTEIGRIKLSSARNRNNPCMCWHLSSSLNSSIHTPLLNTKPFLDASVLNLLSCGRLACFQEHSFISIHEKTAPDLFIISSNFNSEIYRINYPRTVLRLLILLVYRGVRRGEGSIAKMASSSGQGREPPPESNTIQAGERWGDRLSDGARNGGVGLPLQTCT